MSGLRLYTGQFLKVFFLCLCAIACAQKGASASDIVLSGAKIYPSPNTAALSEGAILVSEERIQAIGNTSGLSIPEDAEVIDVSG